MFSAAKDPANLLENSTSRAGISVAAFRERLGLGEKYPQTYPQVVNNVYNSVENYCSYRK
ncbi:hypothetical protein BAU14_02750 [Enterococcus sp. CU9D]|nr:hypothetical protein BAU14_02750 [Enterococcus sp. CU9D]